MYHGWSLYIRAATFGFIIVSAIFVIFGIALPKLGFSSIFSIASTIIEDSHIFRLSNSASSSTSVDVASVSIVSIFTTWVIYGSISIIANGENRFLVILSRIFLLAKKKTRAIERIFFEKSPVEYQLMVIADKAKEDLVYNDNIQSSREEVYNAIKSIRRKDMSDEEKESISATLNEITQVLEPRVITYALITLENEKFYIGLPKIIPEPDEEGVASTSIQIVPVVSGYRGDDKTLSFTTRYDFDLSSANSYDCISIPRDKILTVSGFNFDTHNRLTGNSEHNDKAGK
ncbi:hypothetical protein [Litchfieldella rifensis]|uniref:Uncharacterized protein n=1 Tax=Litchfieldella rifensis TaxID=762643 RepID=A0ABV7LKG1_9GAMM